jgi:hypothetical protein
VPVRISPNGQVLASTEVMVPPSGWTSPHRLALVAAAEDIRVLALVRGDLPKAGEVVAVEHEGDHYVVRAPPKGEATGAAAQA